MGSVRSDPRSLVEGPFKSFTIRAIVPADYDKVCDNVRKYFMRDEVTNQTVGVDAAYTEEFVSLVRVSMEQGMSFLAEDNATGEIAALRVSHIHRKDVDLFSHLQFRTPQMLKVLKIFNQLDKEADIFNRFGVSEYGFFYLASTTPEYRNNGLAKEFYTRVMAYFKALDMKVLKVFTSSPFTRAATKSFETLGRVCYKDFVDPDTGEKAFKKEGLTDEDYVSVRVYKF